MEIHSFVLVAIIVATVTSAVLNVMMVWYIRRAMKRSSLMYDVTNEILITLEDFSTHIDQVHELPLFYGDETIKNLLDHSKEVVEDVKVYRNGFIFGTKEGERFDSEEEGATQEG